MSQKQPAPPPVLAPDSTLAFTPAPASAPDLPPPADHAWLPRGRTRCGLARFALWLAVWVVLLLWGVYAAALALGEGLYVTRLNDLTPYGLWITFDLAVMALAGGAFVTGPLLYFCRKKELGQIDGLAVLLGFLTQALSRFAILHRVLGELLHGVASLSAGIPKALLSTLVLGDGHRAVSTTGRSFARSGDGGATGIGCRGGRFSTEIASASFGVGAFLVFA